MGEERTIRELIIQYREMSGKTKAEVAQSANIDPTVYLRFEQGQRQLSLNQTNRIAKYLKIPYSIRFPEIREVIYPDGLLDELEAAIKNSVPTNRQENKIKLNKLTELLNNVMDERSKAIDVFDVDFNSLEWLSLIGTTFASIRLDPRGEKLIEQAMESQEKLYKEMFG